MGICPKPSATNSQNRKLRIAPTCASSTKGLMQPSNVQRNKHGQGVAYACACIDECGCVCVCECDCTCPCILCMCPCPLYQHCSHCAKRSTCAMTVMFLSLPL